MSKSELYYTVDSKLESFINREIGRRMSVTGITVNKKDIISEIAEHCGLTWEGINRVRREMALPSLPVALKICQYFGVNVEAIFTLEEK